MASRNLGEASVVETSEQVRANGHAREEQQFLPGASFVCVVSAELSQLGRGLLLASDESQGFWDILKYTGQPFHTLVPNVNRATLRNRSWTRLKTEYWSRGLEYRAGVWIVAKAMMTAGRAPTLVPTLQYVTPCHPQVLNLVQDT